jgi:hypothetical protein
MTDSGNGRRPKVFACALVVLCVIGSEAARAASPASALGPETTQAEPKGGYVGRLDVAPDHGPAGTMLTVTAQGLPAAQEFQLVWRTVKGSWKVNDAEYKGREYKPVGYEIAKVKSDAAGHVTATFATPDDFGFGHDIVLQQGERLFIQAGFSLDMSVKMTPESGPAGTPIQIEVHGIGWRQLFNSWDILYDNQFTGWMSAVTTAGAATFTIPATGITGAHIIEVVHGEFTFPYRNPQQNPEPDRPRWTKTFVMTPGPPVLPPAPEQQAQTVVSRLPSQGDLVSAPSFSGVGEPIAVQGGGFETGKSYQLNWSRVTGNRMTGAGWEESSKVIAQAQADASGRVAFHFDTPDDLGGAHSLWVDSGSGKKTGTHWIKSTALPLDVARGPVGTTFMIHLKGVGWTETANIYHVVYDNSYVGYACAFNSQGDVQVFLKATGAPGWHFIDLYPGIYKGTETRPNNFRIPQLTYAQDHPGEDLPGFHYAFEVTPQGRGPVGQ